MQGWVVSFVNVLGRELNNMLTEANILTSDLMNGGKILITLLKMVGTRVQP